MLLTGAGSDTLAGEVSGHSVSFLSESEEEPSLTFSARAKAFYSE